MPFAGEAVCLVTALLWAVAVTLFRRPVLEHGARSVNLAKCLIGALLQGLTVVALGQTSALTTASGAAILALGSSGLVGLTIGDTALLVAVARLGVHRTLLLQTLSPLFAAAVALLWQGELPTPVEMVGAAVILAGVALVVAPRVGRTAPPPTAAPLHDDVVVVERGEPSVSLSGVLFAVLAAFGQGAGLVLAKVGMAEVPVVAASFLRLAIATAGLLLLAILLGRLPNLWALAVAPVMRSRVIPATLLGTYLALFLMMLGVSLAPAAIAATLLSVSPIFALFIDTVLHKQPLTARALIGTLSAVAGVAILTGG